MNEPHNHTLFSSSMKMGDIILQNSHLIAVLPRFGIELGFGEKKLNEVCQEFNVDEQFFLLICNTHTFLHYLPSQNDLTNLSINSLIGYLKESHNYYASNRIVSIEKKLNEMTYETDERSTKILQKFFAEYKNEVISHFSYEDKIVFPYILSLADKNITPDFHINQYEENHSNIDDKLSDLKNILIKYMPKGGSSQLRSQLLIDIFEFEDDLNKHTIIEDRILIPFVEELERRRSQNEC